MRKRLRKKLRRGEFTWWTVEISFSCSAVSLDDVSSVIDDLDQVLQPFGVRFSLVGGERWTVFLDQPAYGQFEAARDAALHFFHSDARFTDVQASPFLDASWETYHWDTRRIERLQPKRRRSNREWRKRRAAVGLPCRKRVQITGRWWD